MTLFASKSPEMLDGAEAMQTCPYYTGTGDRTCKSGCWDEPRCVTNEPLTGWGYLPEQYNEPNPILVGYRNLTPERQATEARWWAMCDEGEGADDAPEWTEAHIEHARRVLGRLARLSALEEK